MSDPLSLVQDNSVVQKQNIIIDHYVCHHCINAWNNLVYLVYFIIIPSGFESYSIINLKMTTIIVALCTCGLQPNSNLTIKLGRDL